MSLPKQIRSSIFISMTILGGISTVLSIAGISLGDCEKLKFWMRIAVVIVVYVVIYIAVYNSIGLIFRNSVSIIIRQTSVSVGCGDIFKASGLRVIGCDTHFDTRVDDVVISRGSLHGQLLLDHGDKEDIITVVESEAKRLGLQKNSNGLYDFPLGTIIRYDSKVDNQTYLMLAMTELNSDYEAHTSMAKYEQMLMKMWGEISRVYAGNDIYFPILGAGITRFDDGPEGKESLLRCMLCTLNSSGVSFNAKVSVLIYGNNKDIPLYEYKDMFHTIQGK